MADVDQLIAAHLPEDLPKEGTWSYRVLMTVADRGREGATDDELAIMLQAPGGLNNIRPRRNELVGNELLEDTGEKRVTLSGKTAAVWTLNPELRRALWPRFTAADCQTAAAVAGEDVRALPGGQRRALEGIRTRLALLGRQAKRAASDIGHPASATVDDESLELRVHAAAADHERVGVRAALSGDGLKLALHVAASEDEDLDAEESERRQLLRARLAGLPGDVREPLEELVTGDWSCQLIDDGEAVDVDDVDEWLRGLAGDGSLAGELQLQLEPSRLEAVGDGVADLLKTLTAAALPAVAAAASAAGDPVAMLAEVLHWTEERARELVDLATRARELLFVGPPGTGKTLAARTLAGALAGDDERIRLVQFHPSYAYEDFVEGIRPRLDNDEELTYELRPGVLRDVIRAAAEAPEQQHFLIVDEINRANLPRVLGELLFALEYRGPGNEVQLPYSGERLYVPENIWLVGTMNTADRSVALMDAAMRRRFKEFRFDVDYDALRGWHEKRTSSELGDEAARRLERLNAEVIALLDDDRAIGHSFLMRDDLAAVGFAVIWREDLAPVLRDHLLGRTDDLPALEEAFLGEL